MWIKIYILSISSQVVGQKQQTLEVGEEQSLSREEKLQKQINELNIKLTMANAR